MQKQEKKKNTLSENTPSKMIMLKGSRGHKAKNLGAGTARITK